MFRELTLEEVKRFFEKNKASMFKDTASEIVTLKDVEYILRENVKGTAFLRGMLTTLLEAHEILVEDIDDRFEEV